MKIRSLWVLDNGLPLALPVAWNSWKEFGTNVDETIIKGIAIAVANA